MHNIILNIVSVNIVTLTHSKQHNTVPSKHTPTLTTKKPLNFCKETFKKVELESCFHTVWINPF